jgi:hypothetical protein
MDGGSAQTMPRHRLIVVRFGLCVGLAVAACSSPSAPPPDGGAGRGAGGLVGGSGGTAGGHGDASAGATGGAPATGAGGGGGADLACVATKTLSCPGVDGTKAFNGTLDASDAAAMCDCIAAYAGGYGSAVSCTCPDGTAGAVTAPPSQAACLAQPLPPSCPITVSQYIACVNILWATPCDGTAFVAAYEGPDCAPLATAACQ